MKKVLVFVFLVAIIFSCDENRIYDTNVDFEQRQWVASHKPEFEFEILDTAVTYSVFCNIRTSVSYPYSNLYLNYELLDSGASLLKKKNQYASLFDKTGKPLGDSGLGDIYDQRIPLIRNYRFNRSGKFRIRLEQNMRMDTLTGVLAVGIRLEKDQKLKD